MRRAICLVMAFFFIFGTAGSSLTVAEDVKTDTKAIDAGNKICPVTGDKIDEKMKATYEYEGKIYNFCCAMCIDEFKKDPQKYIKKVGDELKARSSNEKTP